MTTQAYTVELSDKHVYSVRQGQTVCHPPGCTDTVNAVLPRFDIDTWYLQRGNVCHQFFELLGQGAVLKDDSWRVVRGGLAWPVPDEILPRVQACDKFLRETGVKILATELKVYNQSLNYCGCIDADALYIDGSPLLLDWKNSVSAHVIPQIGLYSLARPIYNQAVAVELKADGNYKCMWFSRTPKKHNAHENLGHAENVAKAVLTVAGFMHKYKLNGGK